MSEEVIRRNEYGEVMMSAAEKPGQVASALDRVAEAIHRLADAYVYVNTEQEEGEPQHMGQSLSDAPRGLSG